MLKLGLSWVPSSRLRPLDLKLLDSYRILRICKVNVET